MHQRQQNQTTTETVRDIELKCSNCGIPFVWTIGEQICWAQYAESQGQAPWPAPRRCQECRRDLKPNSRPNAPPTRGLESDGRSAGSPRRHSGRARQHPRLFSLIRWVARPTATQASPTRRFRCAKPDVRESDDPLTDGTRRRVLARLHRDKERRRDRAHLHVPDDATIQQAIDELEARWSRYRTTPTTSTRRKGRKAGRTKTDFFVTAHDALSPRAPGLFDSDLDALRRGERKLR